MISFLVYIIKSGFCLILFYLGYKALLSKETFFRFNRWVLISGIIICHLLPLIELNIESPGIIQQSFITFEKVITKENILLEAENSSYPEVSRQEIQTNMIPVSFIPVVIYTGGILITFLGLFFSFLSLFLVVQSGRRIDNGKYVIIIIDNPIAPFTWWKYIVLSKDDYSPFPNEILLHELAHLQKKHFWDLLFAECIILFHWFNPSSWLLKHELQDIHEFEADREVLNCGIDATKYQLLLVKKAVGSRSYPFANSFNQSKLKKRITMMCKVQSNKWARWKLLLLIPVAIGSLYAFARPELNRQLKQLLPDEDTTKLQQEQLFTPEFFETKLNEYFQSKGVNSIPASYEKYDWLKARTKVVTLLVNSVGEILYENNITSIRDMPSQIEKDLLANNVYEQPVMIYMLADISAPTGTVKEILHLIGNTYQKHTPALMKKKQPPLLYYAISGEYETPESKQANVDQSIIVNFYEEDKFIQNVVIKTHDTEEVIFEKIRTIPMDNVQYVIFQAPPKTYMGFITDIKNMVTIYNFTLIIFSLLLIS